MSQLRHRPITRQEIVNTVSCPKCGAEKGILCLTFKKKLNKREMSHIERYEAAKKVLL